MAVAELEPKEELVDGLPSGSPKGIMSNWMKGVQALELDPKKEEPSGKTNAPDRSGDVSPAAKPVVGTDTPPEKAGAPDGSPGGDKGGVSAAPVAKTVPEAKQEPAKAEDKEDDYLTAPQPKDKKGWEKWTSNRAKKEAALRKEIQERETKLTELQTKLTEVEGKTHDEPPPQIKAKLDLLEKENKEMSDKILMLDVTEHPRFKTYFQGKTDEAISEAKQIVGQDKAEQVEKLLKLPDNEYRRIQIDEFLADIDDDGAKTDIRGVIRDLRKIGKERDDEIDKASKHKEQLNAELSTAGEKAKTLRESTFNNTMKALQDPEKGFAPFQMREGDDAWNKSVQQRLEAAKGLLFNQEIKPEVVAKAAFMAVALPAIVQSYQTETAAWKEKEAGYEAKIAELVAAQPAAGSGTKQTEEAGKIKIDRDLKPWQQSKAWAKAAMEQLGT